MTLSRQQALESEQKALLNDTKVKIAKKEQEQKDTQSEVQTIREKMARKENEIAIILRECMRSEIKTPAHLFDGDKLLE